MNTNSDLPENRPQGTAADSAQPAHDSTAQTERLDATSTTTATEPAKRRRISKRAWIVGGAVAGVLALGGAGFAIADEIGDGSDALDDSTRAKVAAAATAHTGGGELIGAERDDDGYDAEVRLDDGTEVDVDLDAGFAVISSGTDRTDGGSDGGSDGGDSTGGTSDDGTSDDDRNDDDASGPGSDDTSAPGSGTDADDVPLTDAETTSATDAALAETGTGEVVDIDRSDDRDHAFEVEVRLADGSEVEVRLDADFRVVSSSPSD
jgi:uncharacterized membrane protein YkoI